MFEKPPLESVNVINPYLRGIFINSFSLRYLLATEDRFPPITDVAKP